MNQEKLVSIDRNPPRRTLRQFAGGLPVLGLILMALLGFKFQLWALGGGLFALLFFAGLTGFFRPSFIRPVFVGWMIAVFPIHWLVSHLILGFIFFGVMMPIGLLLRVMRRDPLDRRWDPEAETYWQSNKPPAKSSQYFRQF